MTAPVLLLLSSAASSGDARTSMASCAEDDSAFRRLNMTVDVFRICSRSSRWACIGPSGRPTR